MRRLIPLGCTVLLMLSILACNAGLPTPTVAPEEPSPPTATATQPPPTDTVPPPPTIAPTDTPEPTATPTPNPTPVSVDITFITMITTSVGWGIGSPSGADNHVLRTGDGGNTWRDVTPPEPGLGSKHAVGFFLNAQTAWVIYHPSTVGTPPATFYTWRTTNGGAHWSKSTLHSVEFLGTTDHPPFIHFSDANRGWVMLRHGPAGMHRYPVYLMSTANGGATWSMLPRCPWTP